MPQFSRYIGVDYFGAETADSSCEGLRVYMAEDIAEPTRFHAYAPAGLNWSQQMIAPCRLSVTQPALMTAYGDPRSHTYGACPLTSLDLNGTAVHEEFHASHKAGVVGSQEDSRFRNLVRLSETAQRHG